MKIPAPRFPVALLACATFVLTPATGASQQSSTPATAEQAPGILVSPEWLQAHLQDPHVVVLDAETQRSRYEQGHIPGARFLDMNGLMWNGDPPLGAQMRTPAAIDSTLEAAGVSDGEHVVVYSGTALLASRAWTTLDVMGLGDHVSMLDGGFGGWKKDGRTVSTNAPAPTEGSLTLHPRSDVVVGSDWILHRLDDPSLTILDARSHEQYVGNGGDDGGKLHDGHIPGAYSLPWDELVASTAVPRLDSREKLDSLVRASGAADGSTVVVYCHSGMRASFDYFVARLLGYDVKFYDGSWRDWGSKDLPYVKGSARR